MINHINQELFCSVPEPDPESEATAELAGGSGAVYSSTYFKIASISSLLTA